MFVIFFSETLMDIFFCNFSQNNEGKAGSFLQKFSFPQKAPVREAARPSSRKINGGEICSWCHFLWESLHWYSMPSTKILNMAFFDSIRLSVTITRGELHNCPATELWIPHNTKKMMMKKNNLFMFIPLISLSKYPLRPQTTSHWGGHGSPPTRFPPSKLTPAYPFGISITPVFFFYKSAAGKYGEYGFSGTSGIEAKNKTSTKKIMLIGAGGPGALQTSSMGEDSAEAGNSDFCSA